MLSWRAHESAPSPSAMVPKPRSVLPEVIKTVVVPDWRTAEAQILKAVGGLVFERLAKVASGDRDSLKPHV